MGGNASSWIQGADNRIVLGAVVGLVVVLTSVLVLFLSKRRRGTPKVQGGTKFVKTDDGHFVRRSQRWARTLVLGFSSGDVSGCGLHNMHIAKPVRFLFEQTDCLEELLLNVIAKLRICGYDAA